MEPRTQTWTVRETAAAWRVSVATIRRLIIAGKLKAVRVGRSVRIEQRELDRIRAEGGVSR